MQKSAFSLFGLEPDLALDLVALERVHRAMSAALHPDAAGANAAFRLPRAQQLAQLNASYKQLKDPVSRAEAVLAERGALLGDGNEPSPSPDLLMEVLEAREALSEARRAKDVSACEAMLCTARQLHARTMEAMGAALAVGDLELAVRTLGELRYHARLEKDALDTVALLEDEGL